ncbi:hypothetical protein ACROYT_G021697 [Oculina patagonica]
MVRPKHGYPPKQGLYSPDFETEACGVGFVAKINGEKSFQVLSEALTVLERMKHRGAVGCEENCGDGAGVMTGIPHAFYEQVIQEEKLGFTLPIAGDYATGIFFIDTDPNKAKVCEDMFTELVKECRIEVLGWRNVPYDNSMIGKTAVESQPLMRQVFVTSSLDQETFKKQVYLLRKMASNRIGTKNRRFYICSLSCDTIVYKILSNFRVALDNVLKYGLLIDPVQVTTIFLEDPYRWPSASLVIFSNVFIQVSFFTEKLLASGKISERFGRCVHIFFLLTMLIVACTVVLVFQPPPWAALIAVMWYTTVWLKMVSYISVNLWHRSGLMKQPEKDGK